MTDTDFSRLKDVYEMRLKVAELIGAMSAISDGPTHAAKLRLLLAQVDEIQDVNLGLEPFGRINHGMHSI
ncbi:MAG: hypothetical protein ACPG4U_09555, partial [Pseudomonadales bacterium]